MTSIIYGQTGPAIDPNALTFTARPGKKCTRCLFADQSNAVCDVALARAEVRGLPHCEAGFIYIAVADGAGQIELI
ncbi:hypothetical protein ACQ4WP_26935 [Janthinobacterium sp. GB4P2]|uniref:hypothetical protein n=1 Tax=Janthinobacterium sp. GB4P2 TaxID=3424189 RepID=UPI003F217E0D